VLWTGTFGKKNVSIGIPSSESDIRNGVGAFELEPRYR
jgi:hypothetical protein